MNSPEPTPAGPVPVANAWVQLSRPGGDRLGHAWLAGPFNPRQDVGCACTEIATRRGHR